jgi:predicted PurR-regulated permease PerM
MIVLTLIAIVVALRLAADIMIPLVAATIAALTLGPLSDALGRMRVPAIVSALGIVVVLAVAMAAISVTLSAPLTSWIERAPEIGATVRARLAFLIEPLHAAERIQEMLKSLFGSARTAIPVEVAQPGLGRSLLAALSPAIGQLLVFFGTLFFLLLGRERLRREVVLAFHGRRYRLAALHAIAGMQHDLGLYLGTVAAINVGVGIVVGFAMAAIGLPSPLLWGVLALTLNFVPFLGTVVMACLLAVGGLVTFETVGHGLAPLAAYLVVHLVEAQFLTPSLLGSRFAVNPLFVFLAIVFWTWIWGPTGALLAAPILITAVSIWSVAVAERDPKLPD